MVINPFKAFLLTAGGAVVAAGIAYYSGLLDAYLAPKSQSAVMAVQPQGAPAPTGGTTTDRIPQAAQTPAPEPEPVASEPTVIAPSFDIVRAEADGSLVVAGKAAPGATVEIVAGAQVLGSTKAGPDGDFAIVLDEPLRPGNHELVLRATGTDSVVATSPETAIVAIPEKKDGQVLALVESPGEPSRLITVPEAEAPASTVPPAAAEAPPPAAAQAPAPAVAETPPPAVSEGPPPATAEASPPAATETTSPPPAQTTQPAVAETAPPPSQQEEAKVAVAETLEQPAAGTAEPASPTPPAPVANQVEPVTPPAPSAPASAVAKVSVDAVEIEGKKVFVAGAADPGRRVRVYANDILLGDTVSSPGGRFLVEVERELPVGDYIIRADALESDGAKVAARAAVPFEREAGEAIAAVAPTPAEQPSVQPQPQRVQQGAPEQTSGQPTASAAAPDPQRSDQVAVAGEMSSKLQSVEGSVIIRRGDTLWQISRRVYGRGIRFSTIYLANQDQIRDPDRIWPGQVFTLPEKTPEGDAADLSAVQKPTASAKDRPKAPL